ncbi:hypothetical protein FGSG_03047 [Fusarium graminearum PH-1]|uniref:Chromosome 2, complete genome n=1 Tax=Gibberella zeae (strain ATCC MYA-4620 / CBS 123657 / FGSC 9075 / NRRL 31084 / PH-1) TaxID=229533 RepID=I1RH12_GIBZE|nr:hypothetical protein FGSG_03047 [Fusarium graminearum PH-1]ESU10237.1 hypothetical protein FGSG_03047 [Fusarium graminearum PH-1]CEF77767.1 unnamed protein product [Fusarium graminearum]|eukprot:XP_011322736.1 hypothetical protein FGSG_03047 [Fusarium graminearum PH-1]
MRDFNATPKVTLSAILNMQIIYRIAIIIFALYLSFYTLSFFSGLEMGAPVWKSGSLQPTMPVEKDRRFALVVPLTNPSPNACKTIFSALALGYPSPVIINWGVDYHDVSHWSLGRNLPKIPGMVHYLDSVMHPNATDLERLEEDDLVLMVDARDVWFQLPAEVLLSRYHEINKKANEKLRKQWSGSGPMPMKQTIISATQKKCYPDDVEKFGYDIRCDTWAESPLRPDLYGPETDKNVSDYFHNRPRWLNGGMHIGPAGDMRRLFRRALADMEAAIGEGFPVRSDQGQFGKVFWKQEVWREWQRKNLMHSDILQEVVDENLEYSLGLDYTQEISSQTKFTAVNSTIDLYDADFIPLSDKEAIERHTEAIGISPVRITDVPNDVNISWNPLADLHKSATWSEMPLYADFAIGHVPVIVHHNGHKRRRETWWHKPWYHQRLRELVRPRLKPYPIDEPLATIWDGNTQFRYWRSLAEARDRYPRKANTTADGRFEKMEFGELCRWEDKPHKDARDTWWEEVFRDGKGRFSYWLSMRACRD